MLSAYAIVSVLPSCIGLTHGIIKNISAETYFGTFLVSFKNTTSNIIYIIYNNKHIYIYIYIYIINNNKHYYIYYIQ